MEKNDFYSLLGRICKCILCEGEYGHSNWFLRYLYRLHVNRSANGLSQDYEGRIKVSRETILRRVKEAGGMVTEKRLTETEGVSALSVDDNNSRKGNPSTACTVVIDAETHDILVVAEGANSEVAKKIFDRFPDAEFLSRDRACAYSKAGNECSLEQVADIFHLIQNAHDAVKKELLKELRHNIYIREGDGWVELHGSPCVNDKEQPAPIFTLAEEDITERVHLAHLSERQERKYRKVIALLKLYDEGLSAPEISKRLGISSAELHKLLSEAGQVINNVESKIDEYLINTKTRQCRQKTIRKNARHSSESIVEPYSEIVMRMVSEGHTHRTIHPVIREMGFEGSTNAIYQYILKKRHEESITTAGQSIPIEQNDALSSDPQRPKRVSLQRVAQGNLYKYVLHEAAVGRGTAENKDADAHENPITDLSEQNVSPGTESPKTESSAEIISTPAPSQPRSTFYSDEIADILFRPKAQGDEDGKKKTEFSNFKKLEELNPIVSQSIMLLRDLHMFIDNASVPGLIAFINDYKVCGVELFETFAKGLGEDFNAVKNAILNRNISNGPIEGVNNMIKLLRRTRYGRAKIELINAVAVLSSIDKFKYIDYVAVKHRCAAKPKLGCSDRAA